jgi:hypothetical protein
MDEKTYQEWLKTLKVGDEVGYQEAFIEKEIIQTKIVKITPTRMFRVDHENLLFNKEGYQFYGGKSLGIRLYPVQILKERKTFRQEKEHTLKLLEEVYESKLRQIEYASLEGLKQIREELYGLRR